MWLRKWPKRISKKSLRRALFYLFVAWIVILCVFPFYWTYASSLKSEGELYQMPPTWWPTKIYFMNYVFVFAGRPFARNILNSFIVAGGTTIFCIGIGSLCAYALARLRFRGKVPILGLVLAVSMFPQISIVSPLFLMLKSVRLLDTYLGLIGPYTTFTLPFTIWVLTSFMKEIPFQLEEAAKVDGCTPLQAFIKILFPLIAPGLVTTGLLAFIAAWNEFLFALCFTQTNSARTVPVAIALFRGRYMVPWGSICAAAVIVTVPLIILVLIFQRKIIAGLTAGAIKG